MAELLTAYMWDKLICRRKLMVLFIFLGGKLSGVQREIYLGTLLIPRWYLIDGISKDTYLIYTLVFSIMKYMGDDT